MNTNYRNIFSPDESLLSTEEMHRYLKGELSEKEKNKIEVVLASNPFLADAMEGFQNFPDALTSLPDELPSTTGKGKLIWGSSMAAILLIGLGVWYYDYQKQGLCDYPIPEHLITDTNKTPSTIQIDEIEGLVESHYSDTSLQVTSKQKAEKTIAPNDFPQAKYVSIKKDTFLAQSDLKTITTNPIKTFETPPEEKGVKLEKEFEIYHIKNYKVYDYRGKREEPIKILIPNLGGTTANKENNQVIADELNPITKVYYDEFLKEAIVLFSQEKYKQASKKFKAILKKYPEDANALFYKAMCAFYRDKHIAAIKEFELYIKNDNDTFAEDAFFNLALSYLEVGNMGRTETILSMIVERDGFYKEQAELLLEERF